MLNVHDLKPWGAISCLSNSFSFESHNLPTHNISVWQAMKCNNSICSIRFECEYVDACHINYWVCDCHRVAFRDTICGFFVRLHRHFTKRPIPIKSKSVLDILPKHLCTYFECCLCIYSSSRVSEKPSKKIRKLAWKT
jgi:hypothetical protein